MASAMIPALSIDMAAIVALGMLVIGGVIGPTEAARGFGNTTLLTVAGMFVVAEALHRTGAADGITKLVRRSAEKGQRWLLLALLPVVMVLSGIMNNTGVVVLLLPALITAAQQMKMSPSRLLLPLSYASITGGTLTLIGTTTTLLVNGIVQQQWMNARDAAGAATDAEERAAAVADMDFLSEFSDGLGLLEILPMGAVFCVICLLYLVFVGPKLLPERKAYATAITPGGTRQFLTEVVIEPGSRLVGKTLAELGDLTKRMRLLELVRGEETHWPPFHKKPLQENDLLLVKGSPDEIVNLLQQPGVAGPQDHSTGERVTGVDMALAEVMVPPGSKLEDATVGEAGLRDTYGVVVIAVLRKGEHLRKNLSSVLLRVGDILLVQGGVKAIDRLAHQEGNLILLGGSVPEAPQRAKAPLAMLVGASALVASALNLVPLSMAVLLAAVCLVVGGCLNSTQAYRSINLRIIVVLGCMLGLGTAVQKTGLATDVAHGLVVLGGDFGAIGVLAMIYLATLIVTELVTNVATAGIMIPIALSTAKELHVSPTPFVFAIALAASCSFLTPVGYQTNLLVYGPGGYRLQDYLRLGSPLSLLLWVTAILLLPVVFPF